MHPSKSTTVPVIVFIVLLCDLPLPSTTSSTRSPRSCHLTVAGDRTALPASMTRRPAVVAGPVDSAGTPHSAYTTGGQASAPCQHSYRASILRGTDQHELPWLGNAVPTASSTPSTSSGSGGIRQSDGLLRVARRRRFHVTLVAIGSRQDHQASDNSFRGTSPPRPLPSPWGNDICNRNRLRVVVSVYFAESKIKTLAPSLTRDRESSSPLKPAQPPTASHCHLPQPAPI